MTTKLDYSDNYLNSMKNVTTELVNMYENYQITNEQMMFYVQNAAELAQVTKARGESETIPLFWMDESGKMTVCSMIPNQFFFQAELGPDKSIPGSASNYIYDKVFNRVIGARKEMIAFNHAFSAFIVPPSKDYVN